jgi:hypothetical protein
MNYRERSSQPDDYIDRAGDGLGWVSIVLLGIAFIGILGLLFFVPLGHSSKTINQSEITAPTPSTQSPVFPNPK